MQVNHVLNFRANSERCGTVGCGNTGQLHVCGANTDQLLSTHNNRFLNKSMAYLSG